MVSFEVSTGKNDVGPALLYNLEACHDSAGLRLASNAAEGMAERHRVARWRIVRERERREEWRGCVVVEEGGLGEDEFGAERRDIHRQDQEDGGV